MKPEDRACFNCKTSEVIKVPCVGATSEVDYMGFSMCQQKFSDHYRHLIGLQHVCAVHSDSLKQNKR